MTDDVFKVPDDLRGTFNRLLHRLPEEQAENPVVRQDLLLYLKLGSEKLARQMIEATKKTFETEIAVARRSLREDFLDDEELEAEEDGEEAESDDEPGDADEMDY